jgi:serine/threonine protein kinase
MLKEIDPAELKVIKIIGHGNFATVSLVVHISTGDIMALKNIQTSKMTKKQISYSLNEVRLLESIKIPNVIKY